VEIPWNELGVVALSAVVLYALVIAAVRINGLRSFSKMTGFDFAMTIAIGTAMASGIVSPSISLAHGVVAVVTLFLAQHVVARFRTTGRSFFDNEPLLLVDRGRVLEENLERARVTKDDLRAKLREANALDITKVHAVVLETTGDVSVLHGEDAPSLEWLLEGVRYSASASEPGALPRTTG